MRDGNCSGSGRPGKRDNGARWGRCPACCSVQYVSVAGVIGTHQAPVRKTSRFTKADPIEVRLWGQVDKTEPGCWEFAGRIHTLGYGTISYKGRLWQAHRLAYTLAKSEIPDGLVVMHSCDNRKCINPDHLSLGTVADNNRDREEKGRGIYPGHGPGSWQKRLTHCKRGHEFTPENTRWSEPRPGKNPARNCRACARQAWHDRKKAA